MNVTIDASVWLAAMSAGEREHARCAAWLRRSLDRWVPLHQPSLFVIEVCAAIARRTQDRALAMAAGEPRWRRRT